MVVIRWFESAVISTFNKSAVISPYIESAVMISFNENVLHYLPYSI